MIKQSLRKVIYDRRFFILPLLTIFLMGSLTSLKPLGEELFELLNQEDNSSVQLAEKERAILQMGELSLKLKVSAVSANFLLRQIQQTAELNQLQMLNMAMGVKEKIQNAEASGARLSMQMRFSGDFTCFFNFLSQLNHQGLPVLLNQLVLDLHENSLIVSLQCTILPVVLSMINKESRGGIHSIKAHFRDPFQEADEAVSSHTIFSEDHELQKLRLEQLHYIGYLAEGRHKWALLLLPDGSVQEIKLGDFIGKDKWQIITIEQNFLTLKALSINNMVTVKKE